MERDLLYGVWDPNTETAYLVMDDVLRGGPEQGLNEAVKTILHEIVGHKGLPMLLGEEAYNDLLEDIYDSIPVDDLTLIRYQYGWTEDRKLIAEEYLGMMAEDNVTLHYGSAS
jgi:hypothetical protein